MKVTVLFSHVLNLCFRSYPALHDQCVKCILDILLSPYGEEMFKKAHKELVTAVGECFIMECASDNLLSHLWDRLLG